MGQDGREMNEIKLQMGADKHGLLCDVREIISQARSLTRRSVNSLQVISNFLIGMRIVEEEQGGKERAQYGQEILKQLSVQLNKEFGRGYSHRNLELMRKFYLTYKDALPISQTVFAQSEIAKYQILSEELSLPRISQTLSAKFPLNWSHYLFLMGVSNVDERRF